MHGPFGIHPLRSILKEGMETAPAPKKVVVTESATMSNNVSMQLGSAFLARPALGTDFEPEMVEPKKVGAVTPRVGCDNQGKLAWTIEDLIGDDDPALYDISREWNQANQAVNKPGPLAESETLTFDPKSGFAVVDEDFDAGSSKVVGKLKKLAKSFGAKFKIASNAPHFLVATDEDVKMLLHKVKRAGYPALAEEKSGYIVKSGPGGKKVVVFKPQALLKYESVMEAKKSKKFTPPADVEPGEFDSASGGTAPGKKKKIKVEAEPGEFDSASGGTAPGKKKKVKKDRADSDGELGEGSGDFDGDGDEDEVDAKFHANTNSAKFKAHSGDPKDQKKPFHKGKGIQGESEDDLAEGGWNKFMRGVKSKAKKGELGDYLKSPKGKADRAKAKHGRNQDARLKKRGYKVGKLDADVAFDPKHGFFVEAKTRKQRSKENKAKFAKLSPEEKAKTKGDAPFHPEA